MKLQAFRQFVDGFTTSHRTFPVDGVEFAVPFPFVEVAGPVVVAPVMEAGPDGWSVWLRMDRWEVLEIERNLRLPMLLVDMGAAVRAAQDFGRDSGISWESDAAEIQSWALWWVEQENLRTGGDR